MEQLGDLYMDSKNFILDRMGTFINDYDESIFKEKFKKEKKFFQKLS